MDRKELIQIRVTAEEKEKLKIISAKKGMTMSEFLLFGAMKAITEYELIERYYKKS